MPLIFKVYKNDRKRFFSTMMPVSRPFLIGQRRCFVFGGFDSNVQIVGIYFILDVWFVWDFI
jgi:hypothetical protein